MALRPVEYGVARTSVNNTRYVYAVCWAGDAAGSLSVELIGAFAAVSTSVEVSCTVAR